MEEALVKGGGRVSCVKANNNIFLLASVFKIVSYIKRNNIQLIHAHLPWSGVLARIAGRISGVPVIYTEHNKQERYHPITRFLNTSTLSLNKRTIAVSLDVANSIANHVSQAASTTVAISNGVNADHFTRDELSGLRVRDELGIPRTAIVIGTVAVFREQKRLDLWVEIAHEIRKRFGNVHLVIVGDGPLRNLVHDKVRDLEMEDYVHFTGLKEEVRPFYSAMDIFMMTSIFEGLPIALLEAMSMECAVLSTNAGGVGQVIRNEVDGLVAPVAEAQMLVKLGSQLIEDKSLRQRLASSARLRVKTSFSIAAMVRATECLYQDVLE